MDESISGFFESWIEELARAVEMFTGERPLVALKAADKSQLAGQPSGARSTPTSIAEPPRSALPGESLGDEWEAARSESHWWSQETEAPQKFTAWVGAKEPCWTALGGSPGEGGDPKELFQEMLSQANQGTVAVLSASFPTPLRFGAGSVTAPPALSSLLAAQVSITFRGTALPPLVIALEPAAAKILAGPEAEPLGTPYSMLDRLMDLQLPISVLLGQTSMPIRDALKITSGSIVELDRQLGDYVEVMIHGTVVARGEIVAVRGYYGIRIKEVISRKDRIALKDAA